MASNSKPKQIVDAIQARLLAIAAGATYWYTPDKVAVHPFTRECLDPSLNTAYVLEVEETDHEEETNAGNVARFPITIVGLRRLKVIETPYNPDASQPDRATEQSRLEQDLMNRLFGTPADITLDGLVENIADQGSPVTVSKRAEETFVEGWACVLLRLVPRFSYLRGAA